MPTRRSLAAWLCATAAIALAAPALCRPALSAEGGGAAAPGFDSVGDWLNTTTPPTLAGLRGKVVLVDFWTYSCINCRRTLPYLNRWQEEYGPAGLQVIGIHSPEFGFEHARHNLDAALPALGIRYPVGQDNGFRAWRAWGIRAWPSFVLLDREGRIVLLREGEGRAGELEGAIRGLLGAAPMDAARAHPGDDPDLSRIRSPEIYFGARHGTPQDPAQSPRPGEARYAFGRAGAPRLNQYQLDGDWERQAEALLLRSPRGGMRLRFSAAKLHLVASAPEAAALRVTVDDGAPHIVAVQRPTLYTLLDGDTYGEHLLGVEATVPGLIPLALMSDS